MSSKSSLILYNAQKHCTIDQSTNVNIHTSQTYDFGINDWIVQFTCIT